MITLYHDRLSAPGRAARLVCAEYGVEVEAIEERLWERREGFVTLNPALTLPVIEADGVTVAGIHPVIEYLDETRVAGFLVKMDDEVTRHVVRERVEKLAMPAELGGGAPNSQALRLARANVRHHMAYLEWLSGSRAWLAGDAITYADIAAAATLSTLDYLGEVDWSASPYAKDWYGRMKSRPSFRPLLKDRVKGQSPVAHYADLDF